MKHSQRNRGFSLIEIMIVVAIVGILAAIAYPSYRQQMLRTNRTEGMSALQEAASKQERFFSNNSTYTDDLGALKVPASTEHGHYSISAAACAGGTLGTCYVLTANAQGGQTNDTGCTALTLDSTGARGPAGCW